ncbi:S10 family peptidase [Longibacter salinarum]|nr:carboxypeptidase [Longibacter salinarum]
MFRPSSLQLALSLLAMSVTAERLERLRLYLSFLTVFCLYGTTVGFSMAQAPDTTGGPELYPDTVITTEHTVEVDGETIRYTADAGYLPLRAEDGTVQAKMFYVAYRKAGTDQEDRPITFAFNGGPGSSSVWLHLGALGPRRVPVVSDSTNVLSPPYELVDNGQTWLDFTDLVFIDPVTTGYSRSTSAVDEDRFHGFEGDIESVSRFIRLYTTRNDRWSSPKFLAGESYGTVRAAGLASALQDRHGMYLNGIVLVSAVLNYQANAFDRGNDLVYPLFLPTYAATAHYHGALPADQQGRDLRTFLDEVEQWATTDYTVALMQGDALPDAERERVIDRLHQYTGLSREFIDDANLRVVDRHFYKELLRDEGQTVGRLDSRFTAQDRLDVGAGPEFDPSYVAILGPYTATLNSYVRGELGFETDLPYEILTGRVWPWNYETFENQYLDVAEPLRQAIHKNPALRVHVASGYYDVATPYFATDYVLDHMGLGAKYRDNVSVSYYESGHMMYVHMPSLRQFTDNVETFYRDATD